MEVGLSERRALSRSRLRKMCSLLNTLNLRDLWESKVGAASRQLDVQG